MNDPVNLVDPSGLQGLVFDAGLNIPLNASVPGPSFPNPALQQGAQQAGCVAGRAGREALAAGLGLGFLGGASSGAAITVAGATGIVASGLAAGEIATVGTAGAVSFAGAATVAAGVGVYATALGTTTIANAINSTFGTDLATFSNTGPLQGLFPDFTDTGLGPFGSSGGQCGCRGQ